MVDGADNRDAQPAPREDRGPVLTTRVRAADLRADPSRLAQVANFASRIVGSRHDSAEEYACLVSQLLFELLAVARALPEAAGDAVLHLERGDAALLATLELDASEAAIAGLRAAAEAATAPDARARLSEALVEDPPTVAPEALPLLQLSVLYQASPRVAEPASGRAAIHVDLPLRIESDPLSGDAHASGGVA